jgi:hypothetical protein
MKKYFCSLCFLVQFGFSYGQQFALYNTRTLFDAFENPAQKAFYSDTSKRLAFNFFIPSFNVSTEIDGPAQSTFKRLFHTGTYSANGLTLGQGQLNSFYINENTYVAMFRIFKNPYINVEKGFSWQIKSDIKGTVSNETLAILHNYKLFSASNTSNLGNNIDGLAYHQFSFTYRENFNKRLGLGIKLSYLSGIAYSKLEIDKSEISVDQANKTFEVALKGSYRSNFLLNDADKNMVMPGFKNPGLAVSFGANYKLHNNMLLIANLKDLGFIRWANEPYTYSYDQTLQFSPGSTTETKLGTKLQKELFTNPDRKGFNTLINGKAELLLSKNMDFYQPNLLLSKNLFNSGGHIALVNTLRHRALNFSVTNAYNLNEYFMLGGQFLIKSPNAEFYLGSDQILKSYYTTKGIITSNENMGKGNTAASVYLGFSLKFGAIKERWQNASYIPMNDQRDGFFKRLSKKIFKKRVKGEAKLKDE